MPEYWIIWVIKYSHFPGFIQIIAKLIIPEVTQFDDLGLYLIYLFVGFFWKLFLIKVLYDIIDFSYFKFGSTM